MRRLRYTLAGRELIDTMDAVRRHDFSARDLPGHGLKAVARHFGLAQRAPRVHPGRAGLRRVPARSRARAPLRRGRRARGRGRGARCWAARPSRWRAWRRAATSGWPTPGAATGVLDPLLVRAYLRAGAALPAHQAGDGTPHSGAALHLFATGVAQRIVKADVASLYPSLMREYRIGPARDRAGRAAERWSIGWSSSGSRPRRAPARAPPGSPQRHTDEALSAAMKIVVNSAYGYLGAVGLTRFADVHAANEVTRRGRELLALLCRELARARRHAAGGRHRRRLLRGARALQRGRRAPRGRPRWRRCCRARCSWSSTGATPAMLSHEPKNYALLSYDGQLLAARRRLSLEPRRAVRRARSCARALGAPAAWRRAGRARRLRRDASRRCAAASSPPATSARGCA